MYNNTAGEGPKDKDRSCRPLLLTQSEKKTAVFCTRKIGVICRLCMKTDTRNNRSQRSIVAVGAQTLSLRLCSNPSIKADLEQHKNRLSMWGWRKHHSKILREKTFSSLKKKKNNNLINKSAQTHRLRAPGINSNGSPRVHKASC